MRHFRAQSDNSWTTATAAAFLRSGSKARRIFHTAEQRQAVIDDIKVMVERAGDISLVGLRLRPVDDPNYLEYVGRYDVYMEAWESGDPDEAFVAAIVHPDGSATGGRVTT